MLFTSRKKYLTKDAREIHINESSNLPQLHRLCSDFGFAVLGMNERSATPKKYVLCDVGLVVGGKDLPEKATPEFASLAELEEFAVENVVDIVQSYLFGDDYFEGGSASVA